MKVKRAILVATVALSMVAVLPQGSSWTMSACKECPIHLAWVAVPSPFSVDGQRDIVSGFAAGEGAVVGLWSGRLRISVEPLNQSAPPVMVEKNVTLDLSTEDARPGAALGSMEAGLDLEVGSYRVAVSFFNRQGGWDSYSNEDVIIEGPSRLQNGTGAILIHEVNALDFAGDAGEDLWISRTSDGRPANGSISLRAYSWENEVLRGTTLSGFVNLDGAAGRYDLRIAGTALGTVFPGIDLRRLSVEGADDWRWNDAGHLVIDFKNEDAAGRHEQGPTAPQAPQSIDLGFQIVSKRPTSQAPTKWQVGRQALLNVSAWDVDEEGQPDVLFYDSQATRRIDAEFTPAAERRTTPIDLWLRLNVTSAKDGTRSAEVMVDRLSPPASRGAWVELRNFDSLFARLLAGGSALHGNPQIDLAMEPSEGFVSREGQDVWLWVGHFSTQRFTIVLSPAEADALSDAQSVPAVPFGVVLAVLALPVAFCRRKGAPR